MANPRSRFGFHPAAGTDYSVGDEPTIAARLNKLAQTLHMNLTGISGYRTPAHSVEVGGFANDPHTRGQASDTPGVESVPESTLERFGLTRPFGGAAEADHIQLFGKSTQPRRKAGTGKSLSQLWIQAGGQKNLAPIMAAIAEAESGGKVDSVGGPNSDGSYDYGLWQVNSSHTQFDSSKLISDPAYNARAAVAIYRSQGLQAWSTYSSGAYKAFMGGGNQYTATFGRTRPGGDTPDLSSSDWADYTGDPTSAGGGTNQNVSWLGDALGSLFGPDAAPLGPFGPSGLVPPDPLKSFKAAGKVVADAGKFFQWVAWLLNPHHILQVVEFLTGFTLMVMGIQTFIKAQLTGEARLGDTIPAKAAKGAVELTPGGRVLREAKGARAGRREAKLVARRKQTQDAHARGRTKERKRQTSKENEREMDRKYGGVPF